MPRYAGLGMIGAVFWALIVILWWLFFSRARWYERLGAVVLIVAAAFADEFVVHPSIAGGAMGYLSLHPCGSDLERRPRRLGGGEPSSRSRIPRRCGGRRRRARMPAVDADADWWHQRRRAVGFPLAVDDDAGGTAAGSGRRGAQAAPAGAGAGAAEISEPPAASPVETLAKAPAAPAATRPKPAAPAVTARRADWPGFRGSDRDGVIHGVRIATDWSQSPPVETWRRPIGPGWSSFAVNGNLVYTQEQRGGDEVVSCYRMTTGEPVWRHRDADAILGIERRRRSARHADAQQRSRLHARRDGNRERARRRHRRGRVVAQRRDRHQGQDSRWGISSSPLVVDDVVIVAAGGKLAAYDVATGTPRWTGGGGGVSYSSPHLVTIDGVRAGGAS